MQPRLEVLYKESHTNGAVQLLEYVTRDQMPIRQKSIVLKSKFVETSQKCQYLASLSDGNSIISKSEALPQKLMVM